MKVILNGKKIVENLYSEEQFIDNSKMDSLYAMRKMKAYILSEGKEIELINKGNYNNLSEEFDICFHESEFEAKEQ